MPTKKEKQYVWRVVVALLAVGLVAQTVIWGYEQAVYAELKQRFSENYVIDETTGNMLCGRQKKLAPLKPLKNYRICGRTVQLDEKFGEQVVKVNQMIMDDYAKYQAGEGGWLWRKTFEKNIFLYGEGAMRCLKVTYGFRDTFLQYRIFKSSLNAEGKQRWAEKKPIRAQDQNFVAAMPCHSFHETGRAVDIENWIVAEPYFWKLNIPGGYHGIYKDPYHYSKGEFVRKGWLSAQKQKAWFLACKKGGMCAPKEEE